VIALAACGSPANTVEVKKPVPPSPQKVVLASVQTTTAAKSARLSMTISTAGMPAGEPFDVVAEGIADFTTGDSSISMGTAGDSTDNFEARVVDHVAYMKLPESFGGLVGSDKWLKVPNLGAADHVLPGYGQGDPSQFLAYLETVSSDVKKVGSETIRGVETTHYKATLDLGKAVDRADVPASLRDELHDLFDKSNGAGFAIPAEVWVDGDGLARRIQMTMNLGQLGGEFGIDDVPAMTMSMDLYDFGVPVHVEAPPAADVQEFPFGPTGAPA
jgi:hypothetical protein